MALQGRVFSQSAGLVLTNIVGLSSQQAPNGISAFSLEWNSALNARGPGWTVSVTRINSPITLSWEGIVVGAGFGSWPITFLLGAEPASFQTIWPLPTTGTFPGSIPALAIANAIQSGMGDCITSATGGTIVAEWGTSITKPGGTDQYCAIVETIVQQGEAVARWQCVVIDTASQAAGVSTWINPNLLLGGASAALNTLVIPSASSDGSAPLDMDVSINNGANIFSVMSRTFTEPG